MSTAEIQILILGVCAMLVSGFVWLRWTRMTSRVRSGPRDARRDSLDVAVKQTVLLLVGVAVVMLGVGALVVFNDPAGIDGRAPCVMISFMITGLLHYLVIRAIFVWLRDDLLSRWAEEDRRREHIAAEAQAPAPSSPAYERGD